MASTFTIKQEGYDDPYTYRLGMVGNGVRLCIAAKKEGGSQLFRKEDENIWTSISYDNNGIFPISLKYILTGSSTLIPSKLVSVISSNFKFSTSFFS